MKVADAGFECSIQSAVSSKGNEFARHLNAIIFINPTGETIKTIKVFIGEWHPAYGAKYPVWHASPVWVDSE